MDNVLPDYVIILLQNHDPVETIPIDPKVLTDKSIQRIRTDTNTTVTLPLLLKVTPENLVDLMEWLDHIGGQEFVMIINNWSPTEKDVLVNARFVNRQYTCNRNIDSTNNLFYTINVDMEFLDTQ